jgi:apolipoprotein D and lipocalin family protein
MKITVTGGTGLIGKRICAGIIGLFLFCATESPAAPDDVPPLQTVKSVDLQRYLGKWFEIARFPNSFQKGCDRSTAEYRLKEGGDIEVINTCFKKDNSQNTSVGVAQVEDRVSSAKLKVSFVPGWLRWTGIGSGDYWVIDLGSRYEFAVVSEPRREYLWILSRTPTLDPEVYRGVLDRLKKQHFDLSSLIPPQLRSSD